MVNLFRGMDMAKVYLISCRDAGVDCDFQARASSVEEVMQICADHGTKEHNMKGFGPDLYRKMKSCMKTLDEGVSGATS
jgi:predicted small metal-binding protein